MLAQKHLLSSVNATHTLHSNPYFVLKELLALSTALSASLTAQIDFDKRQMKHCSTYNLAEGVDKDDGKARGIYQMASEEYELAVTIINPSRDDCIVISKLLSNAVTNTTNDYVGAAIKQRCDSSSGFARVTTGSENS